MKPIIFDNVSKVYRINRRESFTLKEILVNLFRARAGYQEFWALRDVSFELEKGQTLGIVGPNGSGKSTILKLIAGTSEPSSGEIEVNGVVSALLELGAGFHPDLTGRENILLNGSILGLSKQKILDRYDDIVRFAELEPFIETPVRYYSSGMYMRLGFSIAINVDPDILLVDEILAVGDLVFQERCLERIVELRRRGVSIVFVSHDLDLTQKICDRVIWLQEGSVAEDSDDPARTIDAYRTTSHQHLQELLNQAPRERIGTDYGYGHWGTGEIILDEVRIHNGSGEEKKEFRSHGRLVIDMRYTVHQPVRRPLFHLSILDVISNRILTTEEVLEGADDEVAEGVGEASVEIRDLALMGGVYRISVAITREDNPTNPYDFHQNLYLIQVISDEPGVRGLVAMPHVWRLKR